MITPCEVFYAALLRALVLSGRGLEECMIFGLDSVVFDNVRSSLAAMCFLSDRVKFSHCIDFATVNECVICLIKNFTQIHYSAVISTLKSMNFSSIELMEEFFISLEVLSRSDPNHNLNAVISPIVIDRHSHLGTFLRRICLDFDTMAFEQHCDLLNNIKEFLDEFSGDLVSSSTRSQSQRKPSQSDINIENLPFRLGRSNDIANIRDTLPSVVSKLAFEAVKSFYLGDIAKSEECFHKLFDYNGEISAIFPPIHNINGSKSIAATAGNNKQKVNTELAIKYAMHNLKHALFEADLSVGRYQHSMMCLSSVWVQHGCPDKAWAGVEEALRIAHQKGDHATIAQALLLIYHIGCIQQIDTSIASEDDNSSGAMVWSRFTNLLRRHYDQPVNSSNFDDSLLASAALDMSTSDGSVICHDINNTPSTASKTSRGNNINSNNNNSNSKSNNKGDNESDSIVWQLQSERYEDDWDGEDILLRCMERCDSLHLPRLSSQASLLFCQHKIRNVIVPSCSYNFVLSGNSSIPAFPVDNWISSDFIESSFIIKNLVYNDSASRYPIQLIWTQLLATSFGDTRLINSVIKMSDMSQLESVLTSLLTDSKTALAAGPKLVNNEYSHSASDMTQVGVHVHLLSAGIWIRQGLFDMALLEYRRLLRNYSKFIPNHTLVSILCDAVECILEYGHWHFSLDNFKGGSQFLKTISLANNILKILKATFPSALPACISNTIEYHRKLLQTYNSLYKKDYDTALKTAEACVVMAGGASLEMILGRVTKQHRKSTKVTSSTSSSSGANAPAMNKFGESYINNYSMLKALLLYTESYVHVEKQAAMILLHQFEFSRFLDKYIDIKYQFIALRAKYIVAMELPLYEDAILTSQQLFYVANHLGLPTLLKHIDLKFMFK